MMQWVEVKDEVIQSTVHKLKPQARKGQSGSGSCWGKNLFQGARGLETRVQQEESRGSPG